MAKILLIDPDTVLCEQLRGILGREGYDTLITQEGVPGLKMARESSPDLVILEVSLPNLDGFSLCRMLRFESDIPIIFLTSRQSEADRTKGLDLGADDYIIKPFLTAELLARIRARLRRSDHAPLIPKRELLMAGDLCVDVGSRRVFSGEREIELVSKEFDLLVFLIRNRGQALSREVLVQHVWGDQFRSDPRTVDVHIRHLRSKIEPDAAQPHYIETVRGHGYRFTDERVEFQASQAA
jgi:DNA-binding response OmpR family regulator